MQTLQVLKDARAIITNPDRWCIRTRQNDTGAMCALGVVGFAANGQVWSAEDVCPQAVIALAQNTPTYEPPVGGDNGLFDAMAVAFQVAEYNNKHSHAEVLAWFDKTIATLEGPKALPESLTKLLAVAPVKEDA